MGFYFSTFSANFICLIIFIVTLAYVYYKYKYSYWKKRGVNYLKPSAPFGNVGPFVLKQQCYGIQMSNLYEEFKKRGVALGGFYTLSKPALMIVDPDLIKSIITKDFQYFHDREHLVDEENDPLTVNLLALRGDKWKNMRYKLSPTFTSGKMKQMFNIVLSCSELLNKVVSDEVKNGDAIDIKEFFARFTTDVIGSCAFGVECNSLTNPDSEFRKYGKLIFESTFRIFFVRMLSNAYEGLNKILKIKQIHPEVTNFFLNQVKQIVEYREKNKVERNDIMNMLIKLKNNQEIANDETKEIDTESDNGAGISMAEVAAQAFIFFFAGYETSSSTMTFCLYELAMNPDIQEKLRADIENALQKHDNNMCYDAVMEMQYLDKIIKETLRKYPVAPAVNRLCVKDYKIPNSNIVIEKGTGIMISSLGLHRDPEYFPEPMKFDPHRFDEDVKSSRHQYSYLPFGEGPRICIGMRFGLLQTKLGIASLIRDYKFSLDSKSRTPIVFDRKSVLLSSQDPILLRAQKVA